MAVEIRWTTTKGKRQSLLLSCPEGTLGSKDTYWIHIDCDDGPYKIFPIRGKHMGDALTKVISAIERAVPYPLDYVRFSGDAL